MHKPPKARDSSNTHLMPAHATRTLGSTRIRLVRVSALLADDAAGVRWCERVSAGLTASRIYSEVRRVAGMVAVYRERRVRLLPAFSRHVTHRSPPRTVKIRALVMRADGRRGPATIYALATRYRCAFCGREFLLDEHGQEYVRGATGVDGVEYVNTGTNRHSRCCRDCLPGLRARLPVCSEDAARDRALEALRKQEEAG